MRNDSTKQRTLLARVGAGAVALALPALGILLFAGPAASAAHVPVTTCTGTLSAPGELTGAIQGDVIVRGVCEVSDGNAIVHGSLTVSARGTLVAAYAHDDLTQSGTSKLSIQHDLLVDQGATVFIGCKASSFGCLDDSASNPTLDEPAYIGGRVQENGALGVVLHDVDVRGNVVWNGGGAGQGCTDSGFFDRFKSGPWFDLEDSTLGSGLSITGINGCWLGVLRVNIAGSFTLTANKFEDPDAIEIGSDVIDGNLACSGNTMVWDTTDLTNSLYPRKFDLNTVRGRRSGQCLRSTRTRANGPVGQYPF